MSSYKRKHVKNDKGLEIFTIDNFLTLEECDYLCSLIEKDNVRSTVSGYGKEANTVSDHRTSSTSTLTTEDNITKTIDERMVKELNIPKENGESFQGQLYEIGQEFKHHHDYFIGDGYNNHCLHSGQRTWTFMIYLNNVPKGGETEFPIIGKKFKPKKGMAVVWKNSDSTGTENAAALHAGLPVLKGKKIIITKWFRENNWNIGEDVRLGIEYHNSKKEVKTFKISEDLPKLTELGFKVVKVPTNTWRLIQEAYQLLQTVKTKEEWDGIERFIHNEKGEKIDVEIFNMDNCFRIKEIIQEELQPIHEEFIGYKEKIKPKWIYGIRSYKRGAILEPHTDTVATHHISSIIIVDKKVDRDWPLDIQDHQGRWHKVYAEPDDMILYESAICRHGRTEPFEGEYFRNFYLHYTLSDYKYEQ